jgi:hypothetical protein
MESVRQYAANLGRRLVVTSVGETEMPWSHPGRSSGVLRRETWITGAIESQRVIYPGAAEWPLPRT